jgi:hypothetical protein
MLGGLWEGRSLLIRGLEGVRWYAVMRRCNSSEVSMLCGCSNVGHMQLVRGFSARRWVSERLSLVWVVQLRCIYFVSCL